jgi:hypothetical protein
MHVIDPAAVVVTRVVGRVDIKLGGRTVKLAMVDGITRVSELF